MVDEEVNEPTEMEMLKMRADAIGVTYSNNIGIETLKQRISDKLADKPLTEEPAPLSNEQVANPLISSAEVAEVPSGKKLTLRQHLINENMKLVRVRITNMDPKKSQLNGEIITFANEHLGTVRKFVPFGEATEDGFHIPYCIYKILKSRQFLQIKTSKNRRTGQIDIKQDWVREFAMEVLPDLTEKELKQLATEQAASGRID